MVHPAITHASKCSIKCAIRSTGCSSGTTACFWAHSSVLTEAKANMFNILWCFVLIKITGNEGATATEIFPSYACISILSEIPKENFSPSSTLQLSQLGMNYQHVDCLSGKFHTFKSINNLSKLLNFFAAEMNLKRFNRPAWLMARLGCGSKISIVIKSKGHILMMKKMPLKTFALHFDFLRIMSWH